MKDLIARLFVISPFWVAYNFHETYDGPMYEETSFSTMLITSVVFYAILAWKDSGRAPRSSVSVIIRNMGLMYCCVFLPFKLLGMGWFTWYMTAHTLVWIILFWQWVAHSIAHHLVYPFADPNYHSLRKAGWHPYWDGTVFNHDSDLIKNGGFAEPEYTNFIPPKTGAISAQGASLVLSTPMVCAGIVLMGVVPATRRNTTSAGEIDKF